MLWNLPVMLQSDLVRARFPSTDFLDALEILDPQAWKASRDPRYTTGTIILGVILIYTGDRLVPEFGRHFSVLEKAFKDLIASNTLATEFQDFLLGKLRFVQHMTRTEFIAYIINEQDNGHYSNFIRYMCLKV
jgi:hypothetical protein